MEVIGQNWFHCHAMFQLRKALRALAPQRPTLNAILSCCQHKRLRPVKTEQTSQGQDETVLSPTATQLHMTSDNLKRHTQYHRTLSGSSNPVHSHPAQQTTATHPTLLRTVGPAPLTNTTLYTESENSLSGVQRSGVGGISLRVYQRRWCVQSGPTECHRCTGRQDRDLAGWREGRIGTSRGGEKAG